MEPLQTIALLILCAVLLRAPRRYALLALFAGVLFLNQRGGIDLGGIRMHAGRFVELAAIGGVILRRDLQGRWFGPLDRAVAITYVFLTAAFLLRSAFGYGTSSAVTMVTPMSKAGDLVDVLLMYFALRGLVRSIDDFRWLLMRSAWLLIPMVVCLAIERFTFRNPLQAFGSMSTVWIDDVDGGRIRCFGSFSHPSLLGTLGAWLAILYVALLIPSGNRAVGILGFALAVAIVLFANSGGPLTSLVIGMIGWGCWFVRTRMRVVRIGIVFGLVLLALVMRDPIWYLPSKMSLLFGGSGWHRSYLMNQAITNIDQWWLAGMPLDLTAPWFGYLLMGGADITNLYVAFGIDGGIGALALLIWLLVVGFRLVGRSMASLVGASQQAMPDAYLVWAIGCGLLVHVANYFSTTYFDQTTTLWLLQLAAVAAVVPAAIGQRPEGQHAGRPGIGAGKPPTYSSGRIRTRDGGYPGVSRRRKSAD